MFTAETQWKLRRVQLLTSHWEGGELGCETWHANHISYLLSDLMNVIIWADTLANWIVGSRYLGISLEIVCSICSMEGGLHSTYCMLMLFICAYVLFACFYIAHGALSAQRCMGWIGGGWMVKPFQTARLGQMTWFDMYFCNMD